MCDELMRESSIIINIISFNFIIYNINIIIYNIKNLRYHFDTEYGIKN